MLLKCLLRTTPGSMATGIIGACLLLLSGCTGCDEAITTGAIPDVPTVGAVGNFTEPGFSPTRYPTRLAVGPDNTIYFSDSRRNAVLGYKDGDRTVEIVKLDRPLGVAISENLLFIGNDGRGTVEVYDLQQKTFSHVLGKGIGEFAMPNAIAISPDGKRVFVVDSVQNRVGIYAPTGEKIADIEDTDEADIGLYFPVAVAVDDDKIVVGDQKNFKIRIYNNDLSARSSFGERFAGPVLDTTAFIGKFSRIQGLALQPDKILVLDSSQSVVQIFDSSGNHVGFSGTVISDQQKISLLLDLAIQEDGQLLLTDPENSRWLTLPLEIRNAP